MQCSFFSFLFLEEFISITFVFQFKIQFPFPGGALKPTDVGNLWVHVTCAWFQPEIGFLNHEKMEPATGILRIPPTSFLKVFCAFFISIIWNVQLQLSFGYLN